MRGNKARCYICLTPINGKNVQVTWIRTELRVPLAVYVCDKCAARLKRK